MSAPDPVSWKVVEPGWEVVDERAERMGYVKEIRGDVDADIFDGIEMSTHMLFGSTEYIPSEQVTHIAEGVVHVTHAS